MNPINLSFRGVDYVIPAARAFEVGEAVERIVTLGEMAAWGSKVPFFTVAKCFAVMLNLAGAKVTKEDVIGQIMADLNAGSDGKTTGASAVQAVQALAACLMGGAPPSDADPADEVKMSAS